LDFNKILVVKFTFLKLIIKLEFKLRGIFLIVN